MEKLKYQKYYKFFTFIFNLSQSSYILFGRKMLTSLNFFEKYYLLAFSENFTHFKNVNFATFLLILLSFFKKFYTFKKVNFLLPFLIFDLRALI
jgi:hypothetical protein